MTASKRRFFTEMRSYVSDPQLRGLPAEALSVACSAVHTTLSRAEKTLLKEVHHVHLLIRIVLTSP
jgi:hypothetical protein